MGLPLYVSLINIIKYKEFKSEKDKTTNENIQLYKTRMMNQSKSLNTLNNITNTNKAIPKEDDCDSDEEAFKKKENEIKMENNEEEELSELSAESYKDEAEGKDYLYAQYDKVHRVKNKWKCSFKDAILQINGKEYIFEKVVGELERDW